MKKLVTQINIFNLKESGFTLIEVLVSVVILATGILGILAMQSRALLDNRDAYLRTQASFLAYDMSDIIKADPRSWKDSTDFPNNSTLSSKCPSACSDAENTYNTFYDRTKAALPDGIITVKKSSDILVIKLDWRRAAKGTGNEEQRGTYRLEVAP